MQMIAVNGVGRNLQVVESCSSKDFKNKHLQVGVQFGDIRSLTHNSS